MGGLNKPMLLSLIHKITDFYGSKGAFTRGAYNLSLPPVASMEVESVFWSKNLRLEELRAVKRSMHDNEEGLGFRRQLEALLSSLFVQTELINIAIYVSQLSGFLASNSAGLWKNLSEFAGYVQSSYKKNDYFQIKCKTKNDFNDCMRHCFPGKGPFDIVFCAWDGKYFWLNNDGSHHLGASYGYAKRVGEDYAIPAALKQWSINEEAANLLNAHFISMITKTDGYELPHLMKKFGVPFQSVQFVTPLADHKVMFYPRNNKWAKTISKMIDNLIARGMAHSFENLIRTLVDKQRVFRCSGLKESIGSSLSPCI